MRIAELWRYPVKSMGGERITSARLGAAGIEGDRLVQVVDQKGRVVTSRSRPRLLTHRARLGPDGEPLVDERSWQSEEVGRDVEVAAGAGALLVRTDPLTRFDVLPLTVTTDGALQALGRDPRRLRPNIIIGDVRGLAERSWEGRALRIGEVVIGMAQLRERCIMTTFDPDTAEQDLGVLTQIHREFDGRFALDCGVLEPGVIAAGDPVELIS
jgi:uncharacterized protein